MADPALLGQYTISDHRQWEGDWELIRGVPHAMTPSPSFDHQRLNGRIFRQLDEALDECPQCRAIIETDFELTANTVLRPDCAVICYQPEGERLSRAPELVFEVVSPSSVKRDEILKPAIYQEEGGTWFVLIYPETLTAKVYRLIEHQYRKQADYSRESHLFELSKCRIDFDFGFIWKK